MIMRKRIFFRTGIVVFAMLVSINALFAQLKKKETVEIKKIWDRAPHNAYSDITFFKGKFYVVFRESEASDQGEGKIRILSSSDGDFWESSGLLAVNGVDLRDPKITYNPKKRLLILAGGVKKDGGETTGIVTYKSLSDPSGARFAEPEPIELDERIASDYNWLWRLTWYGKVGYGVLCQTHVEGDEGKTKALLVSTSKGTEYELISELEIPGNPTEATVRFLTGSEMAILTNMKGEGETAYLGTAKEPYTDWQWDKTELKLEGPNFELIPINKMVVGARLEDENGSYTGLIMGKKGEPYREVMRLPSGGETGHPGLYSIAGYVWMSYHSSHEGKASIYYVRIPYEELQKK